ncbi:MAG: hypothetical protein NC040_07875 [Muribaculaceae bacterium]|nr:hypothetical protein [Alistipes senegalensis]MCM1473962.1 hypothetical protein [Muribaculaceae bacterium]
MYRISKYNPENYSDEWTSITDVGNKHYNLTIDEYLRYEELYIKILMTIINNDIKSNVRIENFEKIPQRTEKFFRKYNIDNSVISIYKKDYQDIIYKSLYDGKRELKYSDIPQLLKILLREEAWFVIITDRYKIDVGYDYYIHIYTERLLKPDNLPEDIFFERIYENWG